MRVLEYVKENALNKTQKDEVLKLGEWMNSSCFSKEGRIKFATLAEINCFYNGKISEHGIAMLEQKFGIKNGNTSYNSGIRIYQTVFAFIFELARSAGRGY